MLNKLAEATGRPNIRSSRPRVAIVDAARGLALCGMVLFHLEWDLAYLHWIDLSPANSPGWMMFGHAVAASFLFLSGVGLVLAHRGPRTLALRRLAVIAGVALAITAVTRWIFPQDYIFFGILHCIAVTNLIALPFLRAPLWAVAATAALAGAAPWLLTSSGFDGPWWWWLGLSRSLPRTLDYRPVMPWLAVVLLGVGVARLSPALPAWRPRTSLPKALSWAGRRSLPIYLAHQPLLLGVLLAAGLARPPTAITTAAEFSSQCRAQCVAAGAGLEGCRAACECMFGRLGRLDRSSDPRGLLRTPTQAELRDAGAACMPDTSTDECAGQDPPLGTT